MKKLVNGVLVDMTPEEEAARVAEDAAETAKPVLTLSEIDLAELNKLLVQDGSVLRGFILLMLDEINILRTRPASSPALQPRTVDQIKPGIQSKMRTP